jgi:hypothetical protein
MPLNPLGVLDLSIVTELLIQTINTAWTESPLWETLVSEAFFTPNITGLTPDAVREQDGCQITVSLIHIEPNRSQRNFVYPQIPPGVTNPPSPRAQMIPALPLGLDLFYFVSAFSADPNNASVQEQQAMSIILKCFHENPIIRTNVVFPGSPSETIQEEFTLTMEIESVDSISRLWQAITAPFRLSLMYRVAVVFLTPPAPPESAKQVVKYTLAVEPTPFPFAQNGQVFGTSSTTTFIAPPTPQASASSVDVDYSPATVTPGQQFFLYGAGLNQGTGYTGGAPNPGTSYRLYLLLPPDYKTEQEITSWAVPNLDPNNPIQTVSRFVLTLPATLGALPANTPPAGFYSIRVGSQSPPDEITNRTNSTPFSIAARVDSTASPSDPVLIPNAGVYTVTGLGFIPGSTELLLETVPLAYVATPPGAGQFTVSDAQTITFQPPANLPAGVHGVRVRVNAVESPPAVWISI